MSNATSRRNSNIRRAAQKSSRSQRDAVDRVDVLIDALDARQGTADTKTDAQELVIDDLTARVEALERG